MCRMRDLNSDTDFFHVSRHSEELTKTLPSLASAPSEICLFLDPKVVPDNGFEEVPLSACKPSQYSPLYDKFLSIRETVLRDLHYEEAEITLVPATALCIFHNKHKGYGSLSRNERGRGHQL